MILRSILYGCHLLPLLHAHMGAAQKRSFLSTQGTCLLHAQSAHNCNDYEYDDDDRFMARTHTLKKVSKRYTEQEQTFKHYF